MRRIAAVPITARPSAIDARAAIRSPIQTRLERLHERYAQLNDGEVATYIPELAKADPNWFGICIATTDGHVYEVGDSEQPFTIQSISKPFTYGLALEDNGEEAVLSKIGVEPTGDAFNAISLTPNDGRPFNPMINAGAIAATSLVAGDSSADQLARLIRTLSIYAARPLSIDTAVYESEKATGHRNRAIGHMLRNFGILTADPEPVLDRYFQQCAISVTCHDLSIMAATLANRGVNPLTGERAVSEQNVAGILSIMSTCGMYDYAGEWVYWVGLPAKSGVAGGILALLPGQLGIGVFSPRLDARGNSVRGVAVCRDLSQELGLHFLHVARSSRSAIRASYSLAAVRSKRRRTDAEVTLLDRVAGRARVYELHGDLVFSALETVVRRVVDDSGGTDFVILDMRRVARVDEPATRILLELSAGLASSSRRLLFVGAWKHASFLRALDEHLPGGDPAQRPRTFADLDSALEWCEEQLVRPAGPTSTHAAALPLAAHETCRGLDARAIGHLEPLLERKHFAQGEFILRAGEPANAMYLLVAGQASVVLALPNGQLRRLATLAPGMAFGELALVSHGVRSADVRADQPVDCYALSAETFEQLGRTHPAIKLTLLENMLRQAYETVTRLNGELAALDA